MIPELIVDYTEYIFQIDLHSDLNKISDWHIKNVQGNLNKTIGLLRKLQNILPRRSLFTVYKLFIRPHLDYRDIIYDEAYNSLSH